MEIFYYLEARLPVIIWGAFVLGTLKGLYIYNKNKKKKIG